MGGKQQTRGRRTSLAAIAMRYCQQPDRHAPKLRCGYPLPCPHHAALVVVKAKTSPARRSRALPKRDAGPLVAREMIRREIPIVVPGAFKAVTTPAWRIRWPEVTPSQNVLMRRFANPHAYQKLIASYAKIFWAAMVEGKIPKASGRRRLTITRFVRSERYRLDRGNLVGGCKPFLDAAVQVGLIRDDREEHLDDRYHQAIDSERDERVELVVEDI